MSRLLALHPDRLFASDPVQRDIARALYATIADAPIVSPHGHTDPRWFADNQPWSDATTLLLQPDHYIFRMLYSQGVPLDTLAIPRRDGEPATDRREAWRTFAEQYHLFRGTPSRLWLDHVFAEVFGFEEVLDGSTADRYFDRIGDALGSVPGLLLVVGPQTFVVLFTGRIAIVGVVAALARALADGDATNVEFVVHNGPPI